MKETYLVTSTGTKSGVPYTSLSRIIQGVKKNGDRFNFVDNNSRINEEAEIPVGTLVTYERTRQTK